MAAIHLIERLGTSGGLKPVDLKSGVWDSGYWKVTEATAGQLVGGSIFMHTAWADLSHFGGKITGYVVHHEAGEEEDGRIIFRFNFRPDHKGVKAPPGAAGEKRIVW